MPLLLGILCFLPFISWAQYNISGKLLSDESGEPLIGANIVIKGTNKGTVADLEGQFKLQNLEQGNKTLLISMVGYQTLEQLIELNQHTEITIKLSPEVIALGSPIIYALKEYPITKTEMNFKEIEKNNFGQDLPIQLNFQPSLVTTSDAGAGVGYTGMRIRGTDPTRINITLNGIPVNDAESHGVFWVNTPDMASSIDQLTIQRGVGTSTNGAGAFGASVNITTQRPQKEAFASTSQSYGSFDTWRHNIEVGTGLLKNKFSFYGRLSKIKSDGYIDKASADLKSFYFSGTYTSKIGNITANVFSGKEITFQAWNGVPEEYIKEGNRTYNELAKYDNEIDDYQQDHYQLLYDKQLNNNWKINAALFLTNGKGYFEQYKEGESPADYNMSNIIVGADTVQETNLIRRRWLDNQFYGTVFSLNYTSTNKLNNKSILDMTFGGGYNYYKGHHFGEVIWAQFMGNNQIRHKYYDNNANKTDFNLYTKANYQVFENFFAFADLQIRNVGYDFLGLVTDAQGDVFPADQNVQLTFFNPKFGLSYTKNTHEWYSTFGVANKEPNRDDFTNSSQQSRPKHETLYNLEVGYNKSWNKFALNINYYLMQYKNQLILTGQINDVGAYTRTNVPDSYRQGIEMQGKFLIHKYITWDANITFSENKIKNFTEYLDDYDNGGQVAINHGKTNIALSPNLIAGSQLSFTSNNNFEISILSKYVGKQYLDNTSNETRKINAYNTHDIRLRYTFSTDSFKEISVAVLMNNALNKKYESNGYTYGWIYEQQTTYQNYYYPQAGRNFICTLNIKI
jgi:iron complex outermembrane receptor protein